MNRIKELYDKGVVIRLFEKEIMPLYPDFVSIKDITTVWHKENIWLTTYHVVVEFRTVFIDKRGKKNTLPIFCTAHSNEPRKNVFKSLKFLWDAGFGKGRLSIPRALFYSKYYNGTFYRGVKGTNIYKFIRGKNRREINKIIPKAAAWFAKLHALPVDKAPNFNPDNSRIYSTYPGVPHILERIKNEHNKHYKFFKKIYKYLDSEEKAFLASTDKRWLVHGDAHPENVIKMNENKMGVIDFTDLCLSDFARDLGSFIQQLEYMTERKIGDAKYTQKVKKLFLDSYLKAAKIKIDAGLRRRIDTYYYWTAMRTATYFLIKHDPDYVRAEKILGNIQKKMVI